MNDTATITVRLETYLVQLGEIHQRWSAWLHEIEKAVVGIDEKKLQAMTAKASELMDEVKEILQLRESLLTDARESGVKAPDLSTLARELPGWKTSKLRKAIAEAKAQLNHIRRIHFSTWVVLHQTVQHYGHITRMLTHGRPLPDVYTDTRHADNQGGRLLNASA